MSRFSATRALIAALAVACGSTADRPSSGRFALVRTELDSMWTSYVRVALAGDSVAWSAFFSDSAYVAEPGAPTLRGRPAIQAAIATELASGRYLDSHLDLERTELVGSRAFQVGTYHDRFQATGQPPQDLYGRLAVLLERDGTGAWRIRYLVAMLDSAVAQPAATR